MTLSETVYRIAWHLGITHLFLRFGRQRQVTIVYHNVIPDRLFDGALHLGVSLTESEFIRQLDLITARYAVVTALDQPGSCVLTFDDFNRNNYTVVLPHLRARGLQAYFFAPLGKLAGDLHWADNLLLWVSYAPEGTYPLAEGLTVHLTRNTRARCWNETWNFVMAHYDRRDALLAAMTRHAPLETLPIGAELHALRFGAIALAELDELKADGNLVGPHSKSHDIMAKLDDEALRRDFAVCAGGLGTVFNTPVYCYPFGGAPEVDARVVEACKAAGFTAAFMNVDGITRSSHGRTRVYLGRATGPWEVYAKTSGLDRFLRACWSRLRGKAN